VDLRSGGGRGSGGREHGERDKNEYASGHRRHDIFHP